MVWHTIALLKVAPSVYDPDVLIDIGATTTYRVEMVSMPRVITYRLVTYLADTPIALVDLLYIIGFVVGSL